MSGGLGFILPAIIGAAGAALQGFAVGGGGQELGGFGERDIRQAIDAARDAINEELSTTRAARAAPIAFPSIPVGAPIGQQQIAGLPITVGLGPETAEVATFASEGFPGLGAPEGDGDDGTIFEGPVPDPGPPGGKPGDKDFGQPERSEPGEPESDFGIGLTTGPAGEPQLPVGTSPEEAQQTLDLIAFTINDLMSRFNIKPRVV